MKQRNYKTLLGATVLASVFCLVSIVWIIIQSYYICTNSGEGCIVWHDEIYLMQLAVFIGRLIFKSVFYLLIIIFLVKQLQAIKNGTLFPRANVWIMYATALCYLIGNVCHDNFSTCLVLDTPGHASFAFNIDTLIYAIMLLVFAFVYKVAADVSEENHLTI